MPSPPSVLGLMRRLGSARTPALYGVGGNSVTLPRPPVPPLFLKPWAGVALLRGRGKNLRLRAVPGEELRHELGLAALIGTRLDRFSPEAFAEAVAGYFLVDELTRLTRADEPICNRKLGLARTLLSPLLPRTAVEPASTLRVELAGRYERVEGSLSALHYSLQDVAAYIAASQPLLPGDMILCGAAAQLRVRPRDRVVARLLREEEELARLTLTVRLDAA